MIRRIAAYLRTRPALGRIALMAVPDWPRTVNVRGIGPLRIRMRRHRSYLLRDPLTHERICLGFLQRVIAPGSVVYDVGANIGLYSRFLAGPLGAGRVIAFEPMRENRELLIENLRLGNVEDRVEVHPFALSNHEGEGLLQVDDIMSGSAALDEVTGGKPSRARERFGMKAVTEPVEIRRLDALVEGGVVPPPDVMKIDVEGAEALVLEGAAATIERHRPDLVVELHGAEVAREVWRFLDRRGYAVAAHVAKRVDPSEFLHVDEHALDRVQGRWDALMMLAVRNRATLPDALVYYSP